MLEERHEQCDQRRRLNVYHLRATRYASEERHTPRTRYSLTGRAERPAQNAQFARRSLRWGPSHKTADPEQASLLTSRLK